MALKPHTETRSLGQMRSPNEEEGVALVPQPRAQARCEADASADLGVSSKYSNENFEDRSGERVHGKFIAT